MSNARCSSSSKLIRVEDSDLRSDDLSTALPHNTEPDRARLVAHSRLWRIVLDDSRVLSSEVPSPPQIVKALSQQRPETRYGGPLPGLAFAARLEDRQCTSKPARGVRELSLLARLQGEAIEAAQPIEPHGLHRSFATEKEDQRRAEAALSQRAGPPTPGPLGDATGKVNGPCACLYYKTPLLQPSTFSSNSSTFSWYY